MNIIFIDILYHYNIVMYSDLHHLCFYYSYNVLTPVVFDLLQEYVIVNKLLMILNQNLYSIHGTEMHSSHL